jgi:hypothetical protein
MSGTHFSDPENVKWMRNAQTIWDIPLHPLSEVSYFNYYIESSEGAWRKNVLNYLVL